MTLIEVKKLLYKQKPKAVLNKIKKGVAYYESEVDTGESKSFLGFVFFEVPVSDMGDAAFLPTMDAKLLNRWLVDTFEKEKGPRVFEIWMEGYAATGEHSPAQKVGEGLGNTFDEAVRDYMNGTLNHGIEENKRSGYTTEEAYNNRRSNWNIWACMLFDNEKDARKSFG